MEIIKTEFTRLWGELGEFVYEIAQIRDANGG
jgi:hypothetical protein